MLYFDSSALVKLVIAEQQTGALQAYLTSRPDHVTSELSVVEVMRAVMRREDSPVAAARQVLGSIDRVAIGTALIERASSLKPQTMRTLDALHIATALGLGDELEAVVAYDRRLLDAAKENRLPTASPS